MAFEEYELQLPDYIIFRRDRLHQRGGGVLLAIKNHLSCFQRPDLEVDAEMLAVEICLNSSTRVLFSVFYRPPQSDDTFLIQFKEFLDCYSNTGLTNLIVTGDFNFPHINWITGCALNSDHKTGEFCNLLDDFFSDSEKSFCTSWPGESFWKYLGFNFY